MKIAVCDDERAFAEQLKRQIDGYYRTADCGVHLFTSAAELIERIRSAPEEFSAVFLDIEMPEMDGLRAARELRKMAPEMGLVFLTGHTELAMEGYEVNALRFLAKPVDEWKLHETLDLIYQSVSSGRCLVLADGGSRILVRQSDVMYIKAENVYLHIVTADKRYLHRQKLGEIEQELDAGKFVRIHRSYIAGLAHVRSYDGKSVIITNGDILPLSRSCEKPFKDAVMNYLRRFR